MRLVKGADVYSAQGERGEKEVRLSIKSGTLERVPAYHPAT
jgi:hypothetical protein